MVTSSRVQPREMPKYLACSQTKAHILRTECRPNVEFRDGTEGAFGVKGMALVQRDEADWVLMSILGDKNEVFLPLDKIYEPGCRFGEAE